MADRTSDKMQPDEGEVVDLGANSEAIETRSDMSDPPAAPTTTFQGSVPPDAVAVEIRQLKEEIKEVTKEIINGETKIEKAQNEKRLKILEEAQDQLIVLKTKLVERLVSYMDEQSSKRQRTKSEEQGSNLPAPDGQRLETLLPVSEKLYLSDMYFVNRDGSMQALLELHFEHYANRRKTSEGRGTLKFPLMDSLFGMGKTTFACKYLALIEKFARRWEGPPDASDLANKSPFIENCCLALKSGKAEPSHTTVSDGSHDTDIELIHGFLDEMRRARTLFVKFNSGDLFAYETRFQNVQQRFRCALSKWGIELPDSANEFSRIIDFIPKPVFIVFDEIGQAFNEAQTPIREQRNRFLEFVTIFCTTALLDIPGVFYLLCGRSEFMWEVGLRPEEFVDEEVGKVSPGEFVRINLNPIREDYFGVILNNTLMTESESCASALCALYPDKTLSRIISELYAITGGHPRTLLSCLRRQDPLAGTPHIDLMINEVKYALKKYPSALVNIVKGVLNQTTFNLNHEEPISGRPVTTGYLASRLHAGYGTNYKSTKLFLAPPILNYILWSNFEYVEYLKAYDATLEKAQFVDKARVFEEVFVKWILALSRNNPETFGNVMAHFCPENSILADVSCALDMNKVKQGQQVRAISSRTNNATISIDAFSEEIANYLNDGSIHIYFPAQKSESPDIIVMPPIEGPDKILIGVQAKCWVPNASITRSDLLLEVRKLARILDNLRKRPGCDHTKGVLILYASCQRSDDLFESKEERAKQAVVWAGSDDKVQVILLNLETEEMRNKFFCLPISSSESFPTVTKVIDKLINLQ